MTPPLEEPLSEPEDQIPFDLVFVGTEQTWFRIGYEDGPFIDWADFRDNARITSEHKMNLYHLCLYPETVVAIGKDEPNYNRINTGQIARLLYEVPDIRLIKRLTVVDGRWEKEPWVRQEINDPAWKHHAHSDPSGEVKLYEPCPDEILNRVMAQQWSYLLQFQAPHESALFDSASAVEELEGEAFDSDMGRRLQPDKLWTVLGYILLRRATSAEERSLEFMCLYPIHSVIWAIALARRLATVPPALRGCYHDKYVELASSLLTTFRKIALDKMSEIETQPDNQEAFQTIAAELQKELHSILSV